MDRICAACGEELQGDYYLKDEACLLSTITLNRKVSKIRRETAELQVMVCPACGHVEFFVELDMEPRPEESD